MSTSAGYTCRACQQWHDELPFAFHTAAPAYWSDDLAGGKDSHLDDETCVVNGEDFFVRGLLVLPVVDTGQEFHWGVWVSLHEDNFARMLDLWNEEGREAEGPFFGWLSVSLPYRPSTLNLRASVHMQAVGLRPLVELEPSDHPLAIEQREGITLARVQEIAGAASHH